jgi:hypothetical protein
MRELGEEGRKRWEADRYTRIFIRGEPALSRWGIITFDGLHIAFVLITARSMRKEMLKLPKYKAATIEIHLPNNAKDLLKFYAHK